MSAGATVAQGNDSCYAVQITSGLERVLEGRSTVAGGSLERPARGDVPPDTRQWAAGGGGSASSATGPRITLIPLLNGCIHYKVLLVRTASSTRRGVIGDGEGINPYFV